MLTALLVLLATAAGLVYLRWLQVRKFWGKLGVTHLSPHFIWGNLTFLQKKNTAIWMRELYNEYKVPYIGIWLFWRPALIINSEEITRRILVKDFDVFRNRLLGTGAAKVDPIGGLNIFTVNDPIWSSMRRRLTPVFTSSKLKGLHSLFCSKSKELVQRIENDIKNNKLIELRSTIADYTTDIISITAFGVNSDATLTGEGHMRSITRDFMKYDVLRGMSWSSIFFFPELVNIFRFHFFPRKSEAYFKRVYKQVVAQRGGYCPVGKENDLLDSLRKIKYEAESKGEEMDEDLIIAQAAIFLQGGFDTTASALTFTMMELAHHPQVQEKLYNELLKAKQSLGDKEFDASDLSEIVYLNCVLKETLRKYGPMSWLDRISNREYKIDDKLTIPAGTTVYLNAHGMHYDPKYYPEPEEYRPERFLPENDDMNRPFLSFGDGPRKCIGMRFAYQNLWYALSYIILKFKVEPLPGAKKPIDMEIEKKGLFLTPGEPFHVKFVSRS